MTGPLTQSGKSSRALRKRRQSLLRKLPPLDAVLRGSLIERYKRCGKPGCKCIARQSRWKARVNQDGKGLRGLMIML